MKKTIFLLFVIALFSQCTEEPITPAKQTTTNTNGSILGSWVFDNVVQDSGVVKWDDNVVATYTGASSDETGTGEFNSDGTFTTVTGYTFTAKMDQGFGAQDQVSTIPETTLTGTYTYDATTKKLTSTANGQSSVADVIELTSNKLVYRIDLKSIQVVSGITVESSNITTTTYTR